MAWFDNSNDATPTPVTFERLEKLFTANDWVYDADAENKTIQTGFEGWYCVIRLISEQYVHVGVYGSKLITDVSRHDAARAWANDWNLATIFGTAVPFIADDNELVLRLDVSFDVSAGALDEQLDDYINLAVACSFGAFDEYAEALGLPAAGKQ